MIMAATASIQKPRILRIWTIVWNISANGKGVPVRRDDSLRVYNIHTTTNTAPMTPVVTKAARQLKESVMVVTMIGARRAPTGAPELNIPFARGRSLGG